MEVKPTSVQMSAATIRQPLAAPHAPQCKQSPNAEAWGSAIFAACPYNVSRCSHTCRNTVSVSPSPYNYKYRNGNSFIISHATITERPFGPQRGFGTALINENTGWSVLMVAHDGCKQVRHAGQQQSNQHEHDRIV